MPEPVQFVGERVHFRDDGAASRCRSWGQNIEMHTVEPAGPAGFTPEPLSSRIFVRCYRHYGDAKRAYDQLKVVAHIPEKRMTVVARDLEWREPLAPERLVKLTSGLCALTGAAVAVVLWILGLGSAQIEWLTLAIFGAMAGAAAGLVLAGVVEEDLAPVRTLGSGS